MGLEPTRVLPHRILSPGLLPQPWYWEHVAVVLKGLEFKAYDTSPRVRIVAAWG